jgi:Protein of unknown function (DUF1573)
MYPTRLLEDHRPMLRWITLASALIIAIGAAVFIYDMLPEPVPEPTMEPTSRPSDGPPPKLEVVGGNSHHFEDMLVGTKSSHSWEFKNVGAGPLEVWLEETTCSCTVAMLKSAEGGSSKRITIAPGRSAPIEVSWEARKPGKFGQAATLGTTDPDDRSVILSILGMVLLPVEVRPSESITLPDAFAEESRRTTLTIVSINRPELKLMKISSSRPGLIVAEAKPMSPEELARLKVKSGYNLAVEIKPGLPPGRFSEEVLIETDHPGRPSLKVALAGNTLGPISAFPPRIEMPNVASRGGASQDLALIVRGGSLETHFEVVSKPEKLRVAISRDEKPEAKGRYRLTVTVPPGTTPGPVRDPIVLKTDHPKVKELRIPVSIFVSARSEAG